MSFKTVMSSTKDTKNHEECLRSRRHCNRNPSLTKVILRRHWNRIDRGWDRQQTNQISFQRGFSCHCVAHGRSEYFSCPAFFSQD
jgi:hypothetical protein